jgi:hypothetical protein
MELSQHSVVTTSNRRRLKIAERATDRGQLAVHRSSEFRNSARMLTIGRWRFGPFAGEKKQAD